MEDSILKSTKKILGLADDYTAFDLDVATHINSALATLNQLGIGPVEGFSIGDDGTETWEQFYGTDSRFNSIKTFVFLNTKLLFDPPATSFHTAAVERQLEELVFRLSVVREGDDWINPNPEVIDDEA